MKFQNSKILFALSMAALVWAATMPSISQAETLAGDAAGAGTAHMHYDVATGAVFFSGTGQGTYVLESLGGNLIAGAEDPDSVVAAIDESLLPDKIGWLSGAGSLGLVGNPIGTFPGFAGNIIVPGTLSADLIFKFQNIGQGQQIGEIFEIGGGVDASIDLNTPLNDTVIRGGTGTVGMTVTNDGAAGAVDLNYTIAASAVGAGITPTDPPTPGGGGLAEGASLAHTSSTSTTGGSPLGPQPVTFTVTDTDGGSDDSPQDDDATLTILDPSAGRLTNDVGGEVGTGLSLDFGDVFQGSSPSLGYRIRNLSGANRAGLDFTGFLETLDPGSKFSTNAAPFADQGAGVDSFFDVFFDTSVLGSFIAQYTYDLADPAALLGVKGGVASPAALTLDVTGNVIVPEPSSMVLLLMGVAGLWVVRRRRAA